MDEYERQTVHFAGNVQGVGFRFTTRSLAKGFPVTGYVQNVPDGRVLLVAEGEPTPLKRFVEAIEAEMAGNIRVTTVDRQPATGEFSGFEIMQ